MIETGRYNQTPHDKRLCPVRDSNAIEDEIHFLCYCPKYFNLAMNFSLKYKVISIIFSSYLTRTW